MQVGVQKGWTTFQRVTVSRFDDKLSLDPKRHDSVGSILALRNASTLFDRMLENGCWIAVPPLEGSRRGPTSHLGRQRNEGTHGVARHAGQQYRQYGDGRVQSGSGVQRVVRRGTA